MKAGKRAAAATATGLALLASSALPASAQNVGAAEAQGNFARDRNISVRQRPRPDYTAPGHRVGGFTLRPQVTATGEYNDNIYATPSAETDDFILHLRPRVDLTSNWSRHYATVYAETTFHQFADETSQNTTDWRVGAASRVDVVRGTNFRLSGSYARLTEPRTTASLQVLSVEPIRFKQGDVSLSATREFNRLRLSIQGDLRSFDYQDGVTAAGTRLEQDDRDRTSYTLTGRADYAVSPDTALFLQVSGNKRDYRLRPPVVLTDRESDGYEVLGGANFELSSLIRGDVGVGYMSQSYDGGNFNDIGGFGARAELEWFPTQLTTVGASLQRSIGDSGVPNSAGFLSTIGTLRVDHELLRNLILTAQGTYARDSYRGIDRRDRRVGGGFSATYLLNRRFGATLGYTHLDQSSDGVAGGQNFKINLVSVALTTNF